MAEQLPDTYYRTPFKFNGKELDEETGLYYYGARYYDPKISIWLSVDPLAESFPNWNPYNYTMQNPINLVDPTGMSSEEPGDGDPPKKGLVQRINEGIRSFFNLDVYRDAEDFAASGGKDDQLSRKLSFNSRLIDGKTKALEKTLEVIVMAHPLGEEAEALAYLMSGNSDAFAQKLQIDGGYYVAGLLLPVVNGKELKLLTNVIPEGKLANHLFKGAGKLADSPANRILIQNLANSKALGVDPYGKSWFMGLDGAGKSIYTYTQNGIVKGAGYATMSAEQMILTKALI